MEETCPICSTLVTDADDIKVCPYCGTKYHSECWEENRGCAVYGCNGAPHVETHTQEGASHLAMTTCPSCGHSHAATDLVCPLCGKLVEGSASTITRNGMESIMTQIGQNYLSVLKSIWSWLCEVFKCYGKAFVQYANFTGRSTRREFLSVYGVWCLIPIFIEVVGFLASSSKGDGDALVKSLTYIYYIGTLCPLLAMISRRFRDSGLHPCFTVGFVLAYLSIQLTYFGMLLLVAVILLLCAPSKNENIHN